MMKIILVIALNVMLAACTVQTPAGECEGQIPLLTTTAGEPLTTPTASCESTELTERSQIDKRDEDISAVHRQFKGLHP